MFGGAFGRLVASGVSQVEEAYGEKMVRTADSARIRHLEQIMANDDHLPELSRKARAEIAEPSRG